MVTSLPRPLHLEVDVMMSRKHKATAFAAIAAVGLAALVVFRPGTPPAQAAGQPAGASDRAADEAAIRAHNQAYAAALTSGDLDAVIAFWATDGDFVDEAGKVTTGKDNIAALFKKALPGLKGGKITGKIHSIKFLKPDIVFQDGTIEATTPTGSKESGRFAAVWSKTDGKWLLSSVRDLPAEVTDLPSMAAAQLQDLAWLVGE